MAGDIANRQLVREHGQVAEGAGHVGRAVGVITVLGTGRHRVPVTVLLLASGPPGSASVMRRSSSLGSRSAK